MDIVNNSEECHHRSRNGTTDKLCTGKGEPSETALWVRSMLVLVACELKISKTEGSELVPTLEGRFYSCTVKHLQQLHL